MRAPSCSSLVVALCLALAAAGGCRTESIAVTAPHDEKSSFRVALLLPGPSDDGAWNQAGFEGLKLIEREFDARVEFVERLEGASLDASAREAARRFATQGFDLVILHGGEFVPVAEEVARDFPRTRFVLTATYPGNNSNLGAVALRFEESGYLAGVIAGLKTKTGKVAYVAGFDYASYVEEGRLFGLGAKSVRQDAEVTVSFLQTWFDPDKAVATSRALVDAGNDVLLLNADAPGLAAMRDVAKRPDVYVIGHDKDQYEAAPGRVLTSVVTDVPRMLLEAATLAQLGRWEGKQYKFGMREGILRFAPLRGSLSASEQAVYDKVRTDIVTGALDVSGSV